MSLNPDKNDNNKKDNSHKRVFEFTISEHEARERAKYNDTEVYTINISSTVEKIQLNEDSDKNIEVDVPVLHEGCSTTCQMVDKEIISKSMIEERCTQYEHQLWSNDQIQRVINHDERFKEFLKTVFPLMMHHLEESVVFSKVLGKRKF
uniref:DUF4238 domain-containing protein n=1 Tax=Parastrongyloides trichosuri TaxID=131310 RepID=A0A0N4ZEJ6_PARTI